MIQKGTDPFWIIPPLKKGTAMSEKTVAILGATGVVGQQMLQCLEERSFPVGRLVPLASQRSVDAGKTVRFAGADVPVRLAEPDAFEGVDIVLGAADKVVNGMEQRDIGIKVGGEGCTTIVIRDGNLMIPPDWNLDEKDPEMAYSIRKDTGITQSDALIIGGGDTKTSAVEAAVSAALNMF